MLKLADFHSTSFKFQGPLVESLGYLLALFMMPFNLLKFLYSCLRFPCPFLGLFSLLDQLLMFYLSPVGGRELWLCGLDVGIVNSVGPVILRFWKGLEGGRICGRVDYLAAHT